jgi:hypothetical protein
MDHASRCVRSLHYVVMLFFSEGRYQLYVITSRYSIAKSFHDKQRVIYTTPIKALSNQKYREFYEEFKDVGLITGDVTINPSATCLIMTTEVRVPRAWICVS